MKLSIVIPVFNERGTFETLLRRISLVPVPKEVVVVDDASTDGTRERIRALEARFRSEGLSALESEEKGRCSPHAQEAEPRTAAPSEGAEHCDMKAPLPGGGGEQPDSLRSYRADMAPMDIVFVYQEVNRGKGAAVREGIARTTGEIVLVQDADLEYDPGDYPALVAPILAGEADVVYGSRLLGGDLGRGYAPNYLANRVLTAVSNLFTGLSLTDMETCYKTMRGEVARAHVQRSDRFGFDPEITAKIARGRHRVVEVPIRYRGRSYAEGKKIRWKDGFVVLAAIVRYALRD